jgi:hypothetical protein
METIDIGLSDLEPISLDFSNERSESKPSVNFGPGIEFLMNDKMKSSSSTMNLNLGELDTLEDELNKLSGAGDSSSKSSSNGETKTLGGFAANLFGLGGNSSSATEPVNINIDSELNSSNLGTATRESVGNTKTWDGFSKLNEIPLNNSGSSSKMTERERRRKKRAMLKKLEEWYEKGLIKHNSRFDMESSYEEIEDEYETALEDKRKKDSVKLQGWWFMTFINSLEYANTVFNPFDLNLDGWGEQISEDIDSYEEIFSELHDKYKGGKLAPEISLLLRVGFSAAVLNFSNKALSSATPAFNDVIKQSPELMRMFTNATVSSMSQASPAFSMANNFVQDQQRPRGPPPPAPVETKNQPPPQRPGMVYTENPGSRPDINAGRGVMFREQGVELNNNFENVNQQERSFRPPQQSQQQTSRQEMRGPQSSDIENILSGLKTRSVNIHEQSQPQSMAQDDDSMISISSLKDLQNGNLPKRSNRRKNRSDRNTISLDI